MLFLWKKRKGRRDDMELKAVGPENLDACLALQKAPGQEGFVESVAECLQEARQYGGWRPVAVEREGAVVGFAMYGYFAMYAPAGRVWLDRLLIDARWQGQGLGRAALRLLLHRLRREYGARDVYLSVVEGNAAAARLYESVGFVRTQEKDTGGETVYVLRAEKLLRIS